MKQIGWGNFRLFYKSYSTDETLNIFKLFHRANHFAIKVKVFLSKLLKQVRKSCCFIERISWRKALSFSKQAIQVLKL